MSDDKAKRIKELEAEIRRIKAPPRLSAGQVAQELSKALGLLPPTTSVAVCIPIERGGKTVSQEWGTVREVTLRPKGADGQGWQQDTLIIHLNLDQDEDDGTEADCG